MSVIKSGASTDQLTVDPASKAARVTLYDALGSPIAGSYCYGIASNFTPAATPTDLVIIEGSATKTVKVRSLYISTTATAAGSLEFFLIKRSTADTTGTFVSAGTPVPLDSGAAAATANRVGHFTANPGALGTSVGTIARVQIAVPVLKPATWAGITNNPGIDLIQVLGGDLAPLVVLRGVAQTLAINFNSVALLGGQVHSYNVVWTEE